MTILSEEIRQRQAHLELLTQKAAHAATLAKTQLRAIETRLYASGHARTSPSDQEANLGSDVMVGGGITMALSDIFLTSSRPTPQRGRPNNEILQDNDTNLSIPQEPGYYDFSNQDQLIMTSQSKTKNNNPMPQQQTASQNTADTPSLAEIGALQKTVEDRTQDVIHHSREHQVVSQEGHQNSPYDLMRKLGLLPETAPKPSFYKKPHHKNPDDQS